MGNSSSKDAKSARSSGERAPTGLPGQAAEPSHGATSADRVYGQRNGSARGSRHDLSFLHLGRGDRDHDSATPERPRETRQEREARRAEKERQARLKERERSMKEEHVDGGYLVTLGTYVGAEDFSKPIVRRLQIERRLAPFWQGLDDHNESWTEAQLVAAARKLPIPAPDAVPPDMSPTGSQTPVIPAASDVKSNNLTIPITDQSLSFHSEQSGTLAPIQPTFSSSGPSSTTSPISQNNPPARDRAKSLASTWTGKSDSLDASFQEVRLPDNPLVNGQPLEACLYKDASECPICFLYYPPYLNRTRCCDQSICSECFVQIKRPDPHPPEHEQPGQQRPPEEEAELLVSEVAACPFCVTPEFGVTYEPPSFRRGLAYRHQQHNPLRSATSAMSSSTSLATGMGRRRATSLSANDPQVITTDRVRPDWAKKLADARAHVLRRSAAATALHTAAYMMGSQGDGQRSLGFPLGRRRRTIFIESPNASGSGTPREGMSSAEYEAFFRPTNGRSQGDGGTDLVAGRSSSRRPRIEDIEELMMMEAIKQSLEAEEERKRKEEKEAAKEAKKKAKADKKEEKKAEKLAKKSGGSSSMYRAGTNDSSSTWGSVSMARSTSNLGTQYPILEEEQAEGKGKQPAQDFAGFIPLSEPTSTLNRDVSPSPPPTSSSSVGNAQRHLEESRANLQTDALTALPGPGAKGPHRRQMSNVSSTASSFADAPSFVSYRSDNEGQQRGLTDDIPNIPHVDATTVSSTDGTPNTSTNEPALNFRSLAAMIGDEEKDRASDQRLLPHAPAAARAEGELSEPLAGDSPSTAANHLSVSADGSRSRGDSGDSNSSSASPLPAAVIYADEEKPPAGTDNDRGDEILTSSTPRLTHATNYAKDVGSVHVQDHGREGGVREDEVR